MHLVGVVGDDDLGRAAARALLSAGVKAHLRVVPGRQTGMVVAVVDASGQRSMLTDRGANLDLAAPDLGPGLLVAGGHLHLSGYELLDEATRPAARAALALASGAGMTCSVDPCSAGPLAAVGRAEFLAWTEGVEWCCANLDEGRALTGANRPEEVLAGLRHHYLEVALTLGVDGALFSAGDRAAPLPRSPGGRRRHHRRRRRFHRDLSGLALTRRGAGSRATGGSGRRRPGGGLARCPPLGLSYSLEYGLPSAAGGRTRPTRPQTTAIVIT